MAAAYYPRGLFYRADLVTEFIPDSSDLVQTLFDSRRKGPGGAAERTDALKATGNLLRDMAAAGIRHRDMNARNVLLEWKGAFPTAHLLDLDRCDVEAEGRSTSLIAMYQRLRRSIRKWESQTGMRITEKEWKSLDEGTTG
jgi:3-deoxy-D-manno-octulosonic acid kinase